MGRPKGSKNRTTKSAPRSKKINEVFVPGAHVVNAKLLTTIMSGQPIEESDRLPLLLHLTGGSLEST